jgi:hypothetical protein
VKLIVLGSGTSTGVPRIGPDWGDCDPNEPKNRRTRVSIIVESRAGQRLLVDTSPDLRHQLLANNVDKVDAYSGRTTMRTIATASMTFGRCVLAVQGRCRVSPQRKRCAA